MLKCIGEHYSENLSDDKLINRYNQLVNKLKCLDAASHEYWNSSSKLMKVTTEILKRKLGNDKRIGWLGNKMAFNEFLTKHIQKELLEMDTKRAENFKGSKLIIEPSAVRFTWKENGKRKQLTVRAPYTPGVHTAKENQLTRFQNIFIQ
jgi:hypothetical protein